MYLNEAEELTAEGVRRHLRHDIDVIFFPEIDSTNAEAKRRIAEGADRPLLILANRQTAGRGRLGRSFFSPSRTGLYMTLVFFATEGLSDVVGITSAAAVAVTRAIEKLTSKKPMIKWVNDILIDDRKVCGILCETVTHPRKEEGGHRAVPVLVGVGVNCTTHTFPKEIEETAGSIGAVSREVLAAEIADTLLDFTASLKSRLWMEEYRTRSLVIGRRITYTKSGEKDNAPIAATALGIDDNGGLIVRRLDSGLVETLSTGEISIRLSK